MMILILTDPRSIPNTNHSQHESELSRTPVHTHLLNNPSFNGRNVGRTEEKGTEIQISHCSQV
jgi:hypothetical protein